MVTVGWLGPDSLAGGALTYVWVNGAPGWLSADDEEEVHGDIEASPSDQV